MARRVSPADDMVDSPADYLSLSLCSFAFWWLLILAIHLITGVYNAAFAKFYWDFNDTFLSYTLESYTIGMPRDKFHTIAYVHIPLAVVHGVSALLMILGSVWKRTLVFSPWPADTTSGKPTRETKAVVSSTARPRTNSVILTRFTTVILTIYRRLVDRHGILGVSGKHFHEILIGRELLETTAQSIQAIRMSKFLPRALLNRFYVVLLIVNCWSSVFIYSRWFWSNDACRQFASIVCDCILDLMSVVGVSVMVVASYVDQYNTAMKGFTFDLLSDDEWVAQMLNEAQMVVVVSWFDLMGRILYSLGLVTTTSAMKDLLQYNPKSNRVAQAKTSVTFNKLAAVGSSTDDAVDWKDSKVNHKSRHEKSSANIRRRHVLIHGVHVVFALWGIVILALHAHASTKVPLVECNPKVHPMAGALPSCFKVNFDCHTLGISGTFENVRVEWRKFDQSTTKTLQFLHCPNLQLPETIQGFARLKEIRMYNSTIADWGAEAAITNTHHPGLTSISIVRVNMTDGDLPLGLQASDFPLLLNQIYFCETDLFTLPDYIDTRWHFGSNIYIENSNLTIVPSALIRLQPSYLTLAGNPMTEFPPELFESGYTQYLILGRTGVSELPEVVLDPPSGPMMIDFANTKISFFWSWIDPLVEDMIDIAPPLIAGGSTYCLEREMIMSGEATEFSAVFQSEQSSLLMNASEENWDFLRLAVDCTPPQWTTQFPLQSWDTMYDLQSSR